MGKLESPKDRKTEILRDLIKGKLPQVIETSRAEASLCELSLQSSIKRERHVWVSACANGKFEIDLEDWNMSDEWDNAVERKTLYSIEECLKTICDWLC